MLGLWQYSPGSNKPRAARIHTHDLSKPSSVRPTRTSPPAIDDRSYFRRQRLGGSAKPRTALPEYRQKQELYDFSRDRRNSGRRSRCSRDLAAACLVGTDPRDDGGDIREDLYLAHGILGRENIRLALRPDACCDESRCALHQRRALGRDEIT